ncbi:MAG: DNA-3-methyladenine glycosylase [Anaerolineales bacterium]
MTRRFFAQPTLTVARGLLGQRLVKREADGEVAGIVVETEAYIGRSDLACHARAGRTRRTEVMFWPPGHAYVYLTYGIHWLLCVVTECEGFPAAVLVRALRPERGKDLMRARRGTDKPLSDGPGKLTQALGIDGSWNGRDLCAVEAQLYFEKGPARSNGFASGPRIGLGRTPEPWLSLRWNFCLSVKT